MYSRCTVLLWVLLLRSSSLRHIRTCYSDDATANIADRRCYRRPQTSISYSVSEKRLLVLIYCECECSEFKESVMSSRILPFAAARRRQSRRCPWLLPVAGVVAACCTLSVLLLPVANTAWCQLLVAAFACVVVDPTTHGEWSAVIINTLHAGDSVVKLIHLGTKFELVSLDVSDIRAVEREFDVLFNRYISFLPIK